MLSYTRKEVSDLLKNIRMMLEDTLHKRVKQWALDHDVTIKEAYVLLLERGLAE